MAFKAGDFIVRGVLPLLIVWADIMARIAKNRLGGDFQYPKQTEDADNNKTADADEKILSGRTKKCDNRC